EVDIDRAKHKWYVTPKAARDRALRGGFLYLATLPRPALGAGPLPLPLRSAGEGILACSRLLSLARKAGEAHCGAMGG
ncbi:MAG: hypothetical protein QOK29_2706, partial [Rhodospirillaceae bacterium]|nr:hypothetical protein [Rhodospirillaceae bacterium]